MDPTLIEESSAFLTDAGLVTIVILVALTILIYLILKILSLRERIAKFKSHRKTGYRKRMVVVNALLAVVVALSAEMLVVMILSD